MRRPLPTVLVLATICLNAQPNITRSGLDAHGITVAGPSDPEFSRLVGEFVPDAAAVSGIQRVLPYAIFVRNTSKRTVTGMVIRFDLVNAQGQPVDHVFQHFAGQRKGLIAPGGVYFTSPISAIGRAISNRRFAGMEQHLERAIAATMPEYERQAALSISVDSVVFDNTTLAGPDRAGIRAELAGHLRAEAALKAEAGRLEDPALETFLRAIALETPDSRTRGKSEEDHYRSHRIETAKAMLAIKEHQGKRALEEMLAALPISPQIKEFLP